jgi:hypothetical protein
VGAAIGAGLTSLGSEVGANMLARPGVQNRLAIPADRRIALPTEPVTPAAPIPQNRALTPYDYSQQTFTPPNFVMQPNQYGPRVVPGTPEAPLPNTLGYNPNVPSTAEVQMNRLRAEDVMNRNFVAQRVAEQEARQAKVETALRKPAGRGVDLVFDTAGNLVEAPMAKGAGGVMPTALESAVSKMAGQMAFETKSQYKTSQIGSAYPSRAPMYETQAAEQLTLTPSEAKKYVLPTRQSQAFNMTAEEKIAWNKAKADLAEIMPGMKALDDKAIANKMMDRQWLQEAIDKAKQKAKLQDEIIARSDSDKARRLAEIEREKLQGNLETLEEQFRKSRPAQKGGQGPKTRAHQQNMLRPDGEEIQNALVK